MKIHPNNTAFSYVKLDYFVIMNKTEIKALLKYLDNNQNNMSRYQIDFIKGAKRYFSKYNKLSEKQIETLVNISKGVMVEK